MSELNNYNKILIDFSSNTVSIMPEKGAIPLKTYTFKNMSEHKDEISELIGLTIFTEFAEKVRELSNSIEMLHSSYGAKGLQCDGFHVCS